MHIALQTLQNGADPPGFGPTLGHKLTQGHLKVEEGDAANHHANQVGHQKRPYNITIQIR